MLERGVAGGLGAERVAVEDQEFQPRHLSLLYVDGGGVVWEENWWLVAAEV